ncbi:hypothetical protein CKO23_25075, partial [Thiocystis violacea]|nr:hypothetical protein [Thiocystis violacea]
MCIHQPQDLDREAIELNKASADALPMTFVDYAELVWKRLDGGQTQQAVADGIGWSRTAVANYASLKAIDSEAWKIVTTYQQAVTNDEDDVVTSNVTTVTPFTERLLREILDLQPGQQLDLCRLLAKGKDRKGHKFGKADFKAGAERYRALNALEKEAGARLAVIPDAEQYG